MRRPSVFIGLLLLVLAAAILVYGLIADGDWLTPSIAEVWASINANSLVGFGSLIENRVDPDLWVDVILPFLTWPLWSLAAIVGVIVLVIGVLTRRRAHADEA